MNIYIVVEISSRELDSKLLLATLAAARGHQVIVSSQAQILSGIKSGTLSPGIFHTKSLSPGKVKIATHQRLMDAGFKITSIDEEGGIIDFGYDTFAKSRYSNKTIEQSSAVFCWGEDDADTLKRIYPNYASKIHKTGSPRADLWKSKFSNYWVNPSNIPINPFLLISSNVPFANNNEAIKPLHERLKQLSISGYLDNDVVAEINYIGETIGPAEEFRRLMSFQKAIKYISKHNNGYDIVLRPHPYENIDAWKILLKGLPNVHVIKEGSISTWINKSFAVMHNSCTTALETTIFGKPLLTYVPFKMEHSRELANQLGYRVETEEQLLKKVNELFNSFKSDNKIKLIQELPEIIKKKIFYDTDELSAEKMIKVWENLDNSKLSKPSSWIRFKLLLKIYDFKNLVNKAKNRILPINKRGFGQNYKFPPLDNKDIIERINRLQKILKIEKKLQCKFFSNRTFLIKQK